MTATEGVPAVSRRDAEQLLAGQPPAAAPLLRYLGLTQWVEFLQREYLQGYVAEGGAKVKLLVGSAGSGKSHQLALAAAAAADGGYLTAWVDARDPKGTPPRVFPLDRLYGEIVSSIDLEDVIGRLCALVVREMGYLPEEMPEGERFVDWVERERGETRALVERRLREALSRLLRDPALDLTFGGAAAQLAAHHLGLVTLNDLEQETLGRWFRAEKVTLTQLRPLQIFRRADRHSARAFLRSLVAVALQAGYRGLVVCVDNLDALLERDAETGRLRYSRAVRDEAYEAIRELVDDVDEARALLFLFAGRRAVLEDEKAGISSYEALRLRLLPEVRSSRFNPFADVVDLDEARALRYITREDLERLAARAAGLAPAVREALDGTLPAPGPPLAGLRQIVTARVLDDLGHP